MSQVFQPVYPGHCDDKVIHILGYRGGSKLPVRASVEKPGTLSATLRNPDPELTDLAQGTPRSNLNSPPYKVGLRVCAMMLVFPWKVGCMIMRMPDPVKRPAEVYSHGHWGSVFWWVVEQVCQLKLSMHLMSALVEAEAITLSRVASKHVWRSLSNNLERVGRSEIGHIFSVWLVGFSCLGM